MEESEVIVYLRLENVDHDNTLSVMVMTPECANVKRNLCMHEDISNKEITEFIMVHINDAHCRIIMEKYPHRYDSPDDINLLPVKSREVMTVRYNDVIAFPLYQELVARNFLQCGDIGSTYTIIESMGVHGNTMTFTFTHHDDFYPLTDETETVLHVSISAKIRIGFQDVILEIGGWSKSYTLFDEEAIFAEIAEEMVKDLKWATKTRFLADLMTNHSESRMVDSPAIQ